MVGLVSWVFHYAQDVSRVDLTIWNTKTLITLNPRLITLITLNPSLEQSKVDHENIVVEHDSIKHARDQTQSSYCAQDFRLVHRTTRLEDTGVAVRDRDRGSGILELGLCLY